MKNADDIAKFGLKEKGIVPASHAASFYEEYATTYCRLMLRDVIKEISSSLKNGSWNTQRKSSSAEQSADER